MQHSSSYSQYVGIDISKDTLDIGLYPEKEHFKVSNSRQGIRKLLRKLPVDAGIVMEATGGYERLCRDLLDDAGRAVCVINPTLVFHFKKSQNQFAKTDKIDAMLLAEFGASRDDLRYGLASKSQRELTEMQRCRWQLKALVQQEKNRATSAYSRSIKAIHLRLVKRQEAELEKLEQSMLQLINEHQEMKETYERVQTAPGVGPAVALTLVASLPELGHIPKKAIGRLVGVAPMANDSGKQQGKRFIQGGRMDVRNALYMAALVGIRHNEVIKSYYLTKKAQGKPGKVALVACMNKLAHILNSMVQNRADFTSDTASLRKSEQEKS